MVRRTYGPEQPGGAGERGGLDVGGDHQPVALDAAHDRLRRRARPSRGLIAAEMRSVSGGLSSFSRSKPGVSVSGGYAHATTMPCGASSARSVSASPRTAYFAGAYAV